MFTKRESQKINGGLGEIKAELVRLETKLMDHQKTFEKHEARDDKRFNGLSDDFKVFRSENRDQHEHLRELIGGLHAKLAWIFGIGIAMVTVAQWLLEIYKI